MNKKSMEQVEADEHSEQPGESRQPIWTSRPSAHRHGAKGWALAARAEDSVLHRVYIYIYIFWQKPLLVNWQYEYTT